MENKKYVTVIGHDLKFSKHEYNEDTQTIGMQVSEAKYPDYVAIDNINASGSYEFNILSLICMVNIFSKEDMIIALRILSSNCETENCMYLTNGEHIYGKESYITKPCNLFEISDKLSIEYKRVKYVCDILVRDSILYETKCYLDRFHTKLDVCYFINSDVMCIDCSRYRKDCLCFDNNGTFLSYQSFNYDNEYQENPEDFNTKCENGEYPYYEDEQDGRNSIEYKKWMKNVLKRDNSKCQCCGSTLNPEVHHIFPYAKYKSLRTDIDNGITLCECCHSSMILGGFHQTYGTRNNTKEQLQEYIDIKRESLGLQKIEIDEIINKEIAV